MKLISYNPFPPGAFPFSQTIDGKTYKWPDIGLDIASQARTISDFRKQNGMERASFAETLDDLEFYTCERLGNDPAYCTDGGKPASARAGIPKTSRCRTCGAKL